MAESELSPLDKLMLAVSASESPKNETNPQQNKSTLNEDELFLAQIAANDLNPIKKPKKRDENIPSTSANTNSRTQKFNKLSLIHSGDTDSSDDESKNPLNECGKEIKHLFPESKTRTEFVEPSNTPWKPKPIPPGKFGLPQSSTPIKQDEILQDPFFGIRISKPLISSALLEERMSNRVAVSMFRVKNFIAQNGQTQDWVIAGCIVQKSTARTSQSGNQYIIWTLSDLQNDLKTVSMFLFKNAYKELWKTSVGTVIGVLNPSILENREGSRHQATLSVDNHQRVMILGQSKDYGLCKSRKKDGEPCTAFVNTNRCSFCLYHVKQEYQKCSLRSDCQSIGGGLTALRNKVLGKNEVFYAGKSYMAIPAKKNQKMVEKDKKRLADLMNTNAGVVVLPTQRKKISIASSLEVSRSQRLKDLKLLQKLNGPSSRLSDLDSKNLNGVSSEVTVEESRQTQRLKDLKLLGPSDRLSDLDSKKNCDLNDVSSEVTVEESRQTALDVIAKLKSKTSTIIDTSKCKLLKDLYSSPAPKLSQNAVIDLNSPIPDRAKLKALQWVKKNGPINKDSKKKSGVKRFLETSENSEPKKSKLEEKAQFSERFRKIMELTSAHADLLEQRDQEEQDKYFDKLENREKMEEKMMSTYKLQCKAVKCLTCKYTSFSAAEKCKKEKHPLKVYDALKRFFKCGNCGNRTVSLDVCPLVSCKNCGSSKWEQTTMMKEKIAKIGDGLSIRGGEQTFVNSGVTDANINLLMPNDDA